MLNNNVLSNQYVVNGLNQNLYSDWTEFIYEKEPQFFITFTIEELKERVIKEKRIKQNYRYLKKVNRFTSRNTKVNTYDAESLRLVNKILHFVNYDLFGRKYKNNNNFLDGFGCLEFQKNKQPHYHFLITNHIEKSELKGKFIRKLKKINQTDVKGFDFQFIGDDQEVQKIKSKYISKMIDKGHMNMGVLSKDGLLM